MNSSTTTNRQALGVLEQSGPQRQTPSRPADKTPFKIQEDPPGREERLLEERSASEQTFWGRGGTHDVMEDRLQNLRDLLHGENRQ